MINVNVSGTRVYIMRLLTSIVSNFISVGILDGFSIRLRSSVWEGYPFIVYIYLYYNRIFTGVCCYVVHQFHWRMLLCCPSVSLENVVMLSIIRTISIEYHTGISCLVLVILLGTVSWHSNTKGIDNVCCNNPDVKMTIVHRSYIYIVWTTVLVRR